MQPSRSSWGEQRGALTYVEAGLAGREVQESGGRKDISPWLRSHPSQVGHLVLGALSWEILGVTPVRRGTGLGAGRALVEAAPLSGLRKSFPM